MTIADDIRYLQHVLALIQVSGEPKDEVIIRSWDFERYLHGDREITEIGIADIDTRDIAGLAPGSHALNWLEKMRVYHFRIRDEGHKINIAPFGQAGQGRYHQGHNFQYGQSEWIRKNQIPTMLERLFRKHDSQNPGQYRRIVLVNHAGSNEISTLRRKFNIDISQFGTVWRTMDLQILALRAFHLNNRPSLEHVLNLLHWGNYHSLM